MEWEFPNVQTKDLICIDVVVQYRSRSNKTTPPGLIKQDFRNA